MTPFEPLNFKVSYEVRFSPDSRLLAVVGSRRVQIWDLESRESVDVEKSFSHASHVVFSPDSKRLAVKNTSGRIAINDVKGGGLLLDFKNTKDDEGCGCVFSPCGKFVLDGSWDGLLKVRDCETGLVVFSHEFENEMINSIQSSDGGTNVLLQHQPKAIGDHDRPGLPYFTKWTWPLEKSKPKNFKPGLQLRSGFAINEGGSLLAMVEAGYPKVNLIVCEFPTLKRVAQRAVQITTGGLAWSPNGSMLAVVEEKGFTLYDPVLENVLSHVSGENASSVDFSPDGRLLACGGWSSGQVLGLTTG